MADDNACDILFLKHGFAAAGISAEIYSAENGSEALGFLNRHPAPDVIVLDFSLPDQTGMDVLLRLKAEHRCSSSGKVLLSGLLPFAPDEQTAIPFLVCLEKPCLLEQWANVAQRIAGATATSSPALAA